MWVDVDVDCGCGLFLQANLHAIDGGPLGQPLEEVQGLRLILGFGAAIDDRRSIVAIDNRHSVIDR